MALTRLPCPHCQRLTAVDLAKLPANRAAAFNCPGCGGKVVVDPAKLGGSVPAAPVAAAPAAPAAAVGPEPSAPARREAPRGEQAAPTRQAAPRSEPAEPPSEPADEETDSEVEELGVPPGTTLPSGVVAGDNRAVVDELTRVLGSFGSTLEAVADLKVLAERTADEVPPLLVCVVGAAGRPPIEQLRPLGALVPAVRRRTFVVLVADNLATLDGNQAFFYQANLVLNSREVGRAGAALWLALQDHRRVAGPLLKAFEEREAETD